ncbi:hypothetical protein BC941DRAFT_435388 [Chlamydoabsidia padenii]|nr:hypothetical protein BC941DRAFT_435388 [Chlamydoabsidia padenii]
MDNIQLVLSYGTHTDCLTIKQHTTWSELWETIFTHSNNSVSQLYYQDHEGDIIVFSTDDEWKYIKQQCHTGFVRISIKPTRTMRWVFDDEYPTKPSFACQFEQFGMLMDKYDTLIQQNDQVKQMMQKTATDITLESPVDLAHIQAQLETLNDRPSLYPLSDDITIHLNSSQQQIPASSTKEKTKGVPKRRYTYYGQSSIPVSTWGEWPAYSSLHPPSPSLDNADLTIPSLYPQPPDLLPAILTRPSNLLS